MAASAAIYARARDASAHIFIARGSGALLRAPCWTRPSAGHAVSGLLAFGDRYIYIRERACVIAVAVCIRVKKERAIEETREGVNNALGVMSRCGSGQRFNALRWFNLGIIA